MSRVVVIEFVSLDGVMHDPDGSDVAAARTARRAPWNTPGWDSRPRRHRARRQRAWPAVRPGRSASWPAEQLVDAAAFTLGGTAAAAFADSHRGDGLARWRGRAVVDVALGGRQCADALADDLRNGDYALTPVLADPDLVADPDQVRGLDPGPVDPDVSRPAGTGGG